MELIINVVVKNSSIFLQLIEYRIPISIQSWTRSPSAVVTATTEATTTTTRQRRLDKPAIKVYQETNA